MSIKGTIFTTDNHGNDWRNFHSEFEKANHGAMVEARIISMLQNEGDRDMIIFYSLSGAAWITHDCGRTLHLIENGRNFLSFKFHPSHMQQILGLTRKECPVNSICVSHNELMLSEDAGKSWRTITSFVYGYEWGKKAEYAFGLGSNAIFVTKQDDKSYDQGAHTTAAKTGVSTYLSWDFFKTETRLIHKGYKFWLSKCCIYVEAFDPQGNRIVYTSEVW